jgi:hypothetical protein
VPGISPSMILLKIVLSAMCGTREVGGWMRCAGPAI